MDSNYVITSDGGFVSEDELTHHGTRGMKWGVRRYQNSDGSLTAEGRKRYGVGDGRDTRGGDRSATSETSPRKSRGTGTDSSGRSERVNKKEATKNKKTVNDEKTIKNDTNKQIEEKKTESESEESKRSTGVKTSTEPKSLDEMSDKDLQARLNRMNNEELYTKKMAERGYVQVSQFSDMDLAIADLKRQKELKTLQKEVRTLDKELNAKEKTKLQKLGGEVLEKVVKTAAINAGEKVLEKYLTEKGYEAIEKNAKKEGEKLAEKQKKVEDAYAKEKAKADAKAAAENAKRSAAEYAKTGESSTHNTKGGERSQVDPNESRALAVYNKSLSSLSSSTSKSKGQSYIKNVYSDWDDDYVTVTNNSSKSGTKSSTASLGQKTVSGYLTAPTSSKSSTLALGERKVAGLLNAPASSSSSKKSSVSITRNATGTTARIKSMKATGNYTNAEIADKLGISESTLNNYLYGGDN